MGADPRRVHTRTDLARELDLLRGNAARGTGRTKVALAELARRVGVPRSTVHTYLTGATLPPAEVLDRIVIALSGEDQASWAEAWDRVAAHEHGARRAGGSARVVPRQLPADVPAFTGRESYLAELDRLLDERTGAVVLSAIAGTPGVGKTALAVHWAHRVADRFPDGQLHVNLRGYDAHAPVAPADAAAMLLRALGVDGAEVPPTLEERASRVRSLVADRRVLLLLDNAGSAEQVRHLLPASSSCFTLVTSRDSLAGLTMLDGAHRLDLDVLTREESLELLRRLLGERVDYERTEADELVDRCARLPLALRIAAEFARSGAGTPLQDIVKELSEEGRRLDLLDSSGDPRSMVRAVFSWSYRRLADEGARLFLLLGCHPGRDFDVPAAAALTGVGLADAARHVDLLVRANIVQATGDRYDMHDLLRDYSRELAVAAEPEATTRLLEHYVATADSAIALAYPTYRSGEPTRTPAGPVDDISARAWLTAETDNVVAVVEWAVAAGFAGRAVRLAEAAARHLDVTSRWPEALRMHKAALAAARAEGDVAAEASVLRHMAMASEALGDHQQALEWLRRCVDLRESLGDRPGVASALTSIGVALDSMSRFDEAIAAHQRSLALRRELGDALGAAAVLLNLGVVFEQRGELDQAFVNFTQALAGFEAAEDPLGQAHARTNLGNVLNHRQRYDDAQREFEQALAVYRKLDSRIGAAFALSGLGVALAHLGERAEAITRYTESLEITAEINDTGLRAEVLNRLGEVRRDCGDHPGARDTHCDALALARTHGDRLEEANALRGLGQVARDTGRGAQARRYWQEALELFDGLRVPAADQLRAALAEL